MAAFCSYGQDVQSKEEFLNEVWTNTFQVSGAEFYLRSETDIFCFRRDRDYKSVLREFLPDKIINELVIKSRKDTLFHAWDCSKLVFTKCLNRESIQLLGRNKQDIVQLYYITTPIFSNDGDYAIFSAIVNTGSHLDYRREYLFKKIKGSGWSRIMQLDLELYKEIK